MIAAVFDFFDGFAARWLKACSAIGKDLDSLADMVSFGVAPASIMYGLLLGAVTQVGLSADIGECGWFVALSAFLIAAFSALRLAKFNIDTRQSESFIGVPTPAMALFICSMAFIVQDVGIMAAIVSNIYVLLAIIVLFSLLMVSDLPLFSLKIKSFAWKANQIRYIFLTLSVGILAIFRWAGLAMVILLYIVLSIVLWASKKQKERLDE
ncbi:phosphatidylserine synthase [Bacteroidia bacterium]|nr:phosphatidylserine synthase [Bacteroidia bacterium]